MSYLKNLSLSIVTISVFLLAIGIFAEDKKLEPGFVSMVDGKTLKGWSTMPKKASQAWSVKKGVIVGEGDKGRSYLVWENHDIADFEMKLCYKFPGKGNSGINLRAIPDKTRRRAFQAYHVDIGHVGIGKQVLGAWDFHTPGRREHACFRGARLVIDENDKPTLTKIKDAVTLDDINKGGWNALHVLVKGNNFKFYINGKLSSEFTENLKKERRLHSGMIQLQLHDPGMVIKFKDLQIKVLK